MARQRALNSRYLCMNAPLCAFIDLDALRHNLEVVRRQAPAAKVLAVVKADAYGHGLLPIARTLAGIADGLGVARLEEAVHLREAGVAGPVLVMSSSVSPQVLLCCAEQALDLVIHEEDGARMLARTALPRPLRVWLKLDSGMHRLGMSPAEFQRAEQLLAEHANVEEIVHMSHFACADEPDSPVTAEQQARFKAVAAGRPWSLANSAAVLQHPQSHGDWVRPGLMLYGASPFADCRPLPQLRPVMRLETELLAVREVPAGERVGYGGVWRAAGPARIGTAAAGYADGYPWGERPLPALVRGRRVQSAGRVSMDLLSLDLSTCPEAVRGDRVLLWGDNLPVEEVAAAAKLIPYTLFTALGRRAERRYC